MFQFFNKSKKLLLKEEVHSLKRISELKSEISSILILSNFNSQNSIVDINSKMHSSSVIKLSREKRRLKRIQNKLKTL